MDNEYSKIIVKRIENLCEKRGVSINMLATMSGMSQSTLDSIINGRSINPTIETLHKIALAFSMTLAEFLDFPELNGYDFDKEDTDSFSPQDY